MKNSNEPLNIDVIEEELNQISPWPWDGSYLYTIYNKEYSLVCDTEHAPDQRFIAKAPERISALVKRIRRLESYSNNLENLFKQLKESLAPVFKSHGIYLDAISDNKGKITFEK